MQKTMWVAGIAWTIATAAGAVRVAAQTAPAVAGAEASSTGSPQRLPPDAEWQRSQPDIVVYIPQGEAYQDTDNEHFLVFRSPSDKEFLATWTQSSCEGRGDNRLMIARSNDGVEWSKPQMVVGCPPGSKGGQASWGFPVVSRTGRIYVFYTKQTELTDGNPQGCGPMGCVYSDDEGHTWTPGDDIPMPRNQYDHADARVPKHWIVWQLPIRDRRGRVFVGYTQCTSLSRLNAGKPPWWAWSTRCQFMRFENIDEGPDPKDLRITWLPDDAKGLEVPHPNYDWSSSSEPAPVLLPDGRLFTTMRTWTGHIWYSVSDDDGRSWRPTEILRYQDDGEPIEHPLAPCPIYALQDGRYLLLFHNNNGHRGNHNQREKQWKTNHLNFLRYPAFLAVGEFRPQAHQPIWFSRPKQILDTGGVAIGPKGTSEIATYTSLTEYQGQRILWYPDRKYHLLGKRITDDWLADMRPPEPAQ